jgi:tyrosyl-tRNA synthetase
MSEFYRLLLNLTDLELGELKNQHPMDVKKKLAFELTAKFFDEVTAQKELDEFSSVFSKGRLPEDMPSFSVTKLNLKKSSVLNILAATDLFQSKGEIRRLILQGAVKLNGTRVEDPECIMAPNDASSDQIIKAGKKIFIRITE